VVAAKEQLLHVTHCSGFTQPDTRGFASDG
jgi:hypothetical protein